MPGPSDAHFGNQYQNSSGLIFRGREAACDAGIRLPDVSAVRYTVALVNAQRLFVYSTVLLLFANGARAGGIYQRTKDGRTRVWNNNPRAGDAATWSGDRDKDRYATGYGTLTWYTTERKIVTGSHLPSPKYRLVGHYSGNMVRRWLPSRTPGDSVKRAHSCFQNRSLGNIPAGSEENSGLMRLR